MTETWTPPPPGTPCWVEIPTTGDVEALKAFYTQVFPAWSFRASHGGSGEEDPKRVAHFDTPQGLSGGIVKMPAGLSAQTQPMGCGMTVYYLVTSLEEIETKIQQNGGKTCMGKTPEGKNAWFMNFNDPEGNRFGAYQMGETS